MLIIILKRPEQRKLYLINIYRPPSGNVEEALNLITDTVRKIRLDTSRHSIIVLGDFNIDHNSNKDQTRQALLLKDYSINNGLPQYIDKPNRFGHTSSSILDLMFTDSKFVDYCGTVAFYMSDHIPPFLVIKKHRDLC